MIVERLFVAVVIVAVVAEMLAASVVVLGQVVHVSMRLRFVGPTVACVVFVALVEFVELL